MRCVLCFVGAFFVSLFAWSAALQEPANIRGNFLQFELSPNAGGVIDQLTLLGTGNEIAGDGGILQEGFGVASYYVPNRRLNEKLTILDQYTDRPVLLYEYECDGPNIDGLHVQRMMEPLPDEASIRVTWIVENRGRTRQWIAPWVRNDFAPGGTVDGADKIELPSLKGVVSAARPAYYPAARNWIAATDANRQETAYGTFDADRTYAFLALWDPARQLCGTQVAFVPFMIQPGDRWETVYRLNVVRGLQRVDFATDELALQLDYAGGKLVALVSSVRAFEQARIEARVVASNGRVWKLDAKQFTLNPNQLARCTYDWQPPAEGSYDFLAQLQVNGRPFALGSDTNSPHGGIDAQFVVGTPVERTLEAWTDAPYALDHGARRYRRALARETPAEMWFEHSLWKVFPEDVVEPSGAVQDTGSISLAKGERESLQLVLRPPLGQRLRKVRVRAHSLTSAHTDAAIGENDIRIYKVAYQDIRVPSHLEGATGKWPDMLPPIEPFDVEGGRAQPIWLTVYARPDLPSGRYRGMLEIIADGVEPIELWLEAEVFDFELPKVSALTTDFGVVTENLRGLADLSACLENAEEHRVTLRAPGAFPEPGASESLEVVYPRVLETLQERGVTSVAVPPDYLSDPSALRAANQVVVDNGLQHRVFVPLADQPPPPAYAEVIERAAQWKSLAPDIPVMVTTRGLNPLLSDNIDLWAVHTQVFDSENNRPLLQSIAGGREVWCFVNHAPPRPYANFFVDFAAVEHRVLFWQAWALGLRGMHYWAVNYAPPDDDPWENVLDSTPVNGDGLLLYPDPTAPVNSIRWEVIRDGIEDYDYLALFMDRRAKLQATGGHEALLTEAANAYNLSELVPNLIAFPREPEILLRKRLEIARMIEKMDAALD